MARRRDRQPNARKAYQAHHHRVQRYTLQIDRLYAQLVAGSVQLVEALGDTTGDNPTLARALGQIKRTFAMQMLENVRLGIANEWEQASREQDDMAKRLFAGNYPERYTSNRPEALQAFMARKTNGLTLSDRVWRLADHAEHEVTTAIALGLEDGLSAHELSREVKKYLNDPDRLFRRVRDSKGQLKLSKPAQAYHAGRGVYRSSHKNALRLTRTEINIAYRRSEQIRWLAMDFVVGYEIKRSGTGYDCPVCEALAGKYPKTFVWSTWHPHCRCYAIPILKSEDELFAPPHTPSAHEVTAPPSGYTRWLRTNRHRLATNPPLFVQENLNIAPKTIADKRSEYRLAYQDRKTGGRNYYHKDHQFNKQGGGGDAEKIVGKLLAQKGKIVEFLPEGTIDGIKSPDLRFDGKLWDIKCVNTDNQRTIRKAYIDAMKKAEAVIFYDQDKTRYELICSAVARELGNLSKAGKPPIDAYYITEEAGLIKIT